MTVLDTFPKQPNEVLDYDIDFSDWLAERDDTIASVTADCDDGIEVDLVTHLNGVVKLWMVGGTSGRSYKVTATVVTADGRTKEGDIRIQVREL